MTTIAYRNGALAADTQEMAGGSILGYAVKIARRDDGCMAGAAGDAAYSHAFLKWFSAGEIGDAPEARGEDNSFDRGVIFRPDGIIDVQESRGWHQTRAEYYALGSGRPEALGAMFAGADAETAVRAAMAHDSSTGGEVIVFHANPPTGRG